MDLSRKQVKSLLEVISEDESRPVLTAAKVDKHGDKTVLVATNGWVLAELSAPELSEYVGMYLTRAELNKWYKLASPRDRLSDQGIAEMLVPTDHFSNDYPNWQLLIDGLNQQPIESIYVNPKFLAIMEALAGEHLKWLFHGSKAALKAEFEGSTYLVMPMR